MIKNILLIIIGFIILLKGADIFIDGIVSTSNNLKISKLIIALTVVAFGTSSPEFAISVQGLLNDSGNIVLANVIGSTIVNTMLVIGVAAIIKPIKAKNETVKKQLPIHLGIIILFSLLFVFGNKITRLDGAILFISFLMFLIYIVRYAKSHSSNSKKIETPRWKTSTSIIISIIGLIAITVGSDLSVNNCTELAQHIGISEKLITMVLIVIGTSMPELAMAISSAKKKEFDIILGNIIGTNIFNIGFVLGLPVMLFGTVSASDFNIIDMFIVFLSALTIYLFAKDDKTISKTEGFIMLAVFIEYYIYVILTGL